MNAPSERPAWFWRSVWLDPETGKPTKPLAFFGCVLAALAGAAWFQSDPNLSPAALRALFILCLAVLLWVSEVIPAFAVGILVIALNVALLGQPDGIYAQTSTDWEEFVVVLGHPLIWLFFGGFVLAAGMERCGLDKRLAWALLKRVDRRYSSVLLATMVATFVLSMFMSNTATAAMMLAVFVPLLGTVPSTSPARKGSLLGIAAAANLGGMGSLIGTPPNAIAVAALTKLEPQQDITFLGWILLGFIPASVMLLVVWRFLLWRYPDPACLIEVDAHQPVTSVDTHLTTPAPPQWQFVVVSLTLAATIGLWLTSPLHGIPTAAVSFLPIVILTSTGVLSAADVRRLNYDVLFLMAGGLALGQVVTSTGLSDWIVAQIPIQSLSPGMLALVMGYATVVMSNFMSNTAAANVLIPLGISLAVGSESLIAISVAFGASAGMCLPVATPPNAMVYAVGDLQTRDFVLVGLLVGLLTPPLGLLWVSLCLSLFG